MRKRVLLFGSTGSIGLSALRVIDLNPERFELCALTAGNNEKLFLKQVRKYNPPWLYIREERAARRLAGLFPGKKIFWGRQGLTDLARECPGEIALFAVSGTAALEATFAVLSRGMRIALANKEVLVCAGRLFNEYAARHQSEVLPIDSELSAIFQCLNGRDRGQARRIFLTASGGPFFKKNRSELKKVTLREALRHPVWKMGRKITIDSATLMNKALEMIESRALFGFEPRMIEVLIHPQSLVHSLVEFADGSLLAQVSVADMALPIQLALTYPERAASDHFTLQWQRFASLEFHRPDLRRFKALRLAYRAMETGQSAPLALHVANEVAVEAFMAERIRFHRIVDFVEEFLDETAFCEPRTVDEVLAAQEEYRRKAIEKISRGS